MNAYYLSNLNKLIVYIKENVKNKKFVIISIFGASCSGKSHISSILSKKLNAKILDMDSYYKGIEFSNNFDIPQSIDFKLLNNQIKEIKKGEIIHKPIYNFKEHKRQGYEEFVPSHITIFEGIFAYKINSDLKIFIESEEEVMLLRRIKRDSKERGRNKKEIKDRWQKQVIPMYKKYILANKNLADIQIIN